jgi:hypothetical protein
MAFLNWLADQPGYKSKIHRSDIAYLSPDRKSETARRTTCWKPHPSPAQVRACSLKCPMVRYSNGGTARSSRFCS